MDGFGLLMVFAVAFFIYFIPSWIGWNKRNANAIIALNFFLGWTLVGWLAAFIWSLAEDDPPQSNVTIVKESDNFDKLEKLKGLLDNGAITNDEYEIEKAKLLGEKRVIKPGNTVEL